MILGNEKVDQVGCFTYLGSIISKNDGCRNNVKSRLVKTQNVFSQSKKVCENRKTSLRNMIRILEATVIKHSSETLASQKTK